MTLNEYLASLAVRDKDLAFLTKGEWKTVLETVGKLDAGNAPIGHDEANNYGRAAVDVLRANATLQSKEVGAVLKEAARAAAAMEDLPSASRGGSLAYVEMRDGAVTSIDRPSFPKSTKEALSERYRSEKGQPVREADGRADLHDRHMLPWHDIAKFGIAVANDPDARRAFVDRIGALRAAAKDGGDKLPPWNELGPKFDKRLEQLAKHSTATVEARTDRASLELGLSLMNGSTDNLWRGRGDENVSRNSTASGLDSGFDGATTVDAARKLAEKWRADAQKDLALGTTVDTLRGTLKEIGADYLSRLAKEAEAKGIAGGPEFATLRKTFAGEFRQNVVEQSDFDLGNVDARQRERFDAFKALKPDTFAGIVTGSVKPTPEATREVLDAFTRYADPKARALDAKAAVAPAQVDGKPGVDAPILDGKQIVPDVDMVQAPPVMQPPQPDPQLLKKRSADEAQLKVGDAKVLKDAQHDVKPPVQSMELTQ